MKDFFNKETLDNIKQFCAENKKYVGVAGVLVGLILILIVVVAGGNMADNPIPSRITDRDFGEGF